MKLRVGPSTLPLGLSTVASTIWARTSSSERPRLASFAAEIERFHRTLQELSDDFGNESLTATISDEQFLQGPLADAMTHAGQLAMLRRLSGGAVPPENFIFAKIGPDNLTPQQADPAAPDKGWKPEHGHIAPGAFRE